MLGLHHTPRRVAFKRPWPTTTRGLILWLFSLGFIIIGGVNYIGTQPTGQSYKNLAVAIGVARWLGMDVWVYGIIFCVVGLFCAWTSYCHNDSDHLGYTVAATWAAAWGLAEACGILHGAGPRAVGAATLWLIYSAILTVCAGIEYRPFSCNRDYVRG